MKDIEYYTLYEMAYELKMSPQEFKNSHTSSEFNDWIAFLEEKRERDWHRLDQAHYYLAQVALEIVRMAVTPEEAKKLTLDQFLIKYEQKRRTPKVEMTPEKRKEFIYQQKCLFGAIFNAPVPSK